MNPFRRLTPIVPILLLSLSVPGRTADSGQDQKQRAVSALEQAVKADPGNSELWLHLGFAYHKLGQIDPAQTAFEKAATLDPHSRDALYMLGLIYEKKGQKQEALKVWKQYLSTETDTAKRDVAEKHIHQMSQ